MCSLVRVQTINPPVTLRHHPVFPASPYLISSIAQSWGRVQPFLMSFMSTHQISMHWSPIWQYFRVRVHHFLLLIAINLDNSPDFFCIFLFCSHMSLLVLSLLSDSLFVKSNLEHTVYSRWTFKPVLEICVCLLPDAFCFFFLPPEFLLFLPWVTFMQLC